MDRVVVINGVLATQEDKNLLSYNILYNNLEFDVKVDEFGVQYVTTFD